MSTEPPPIPEIPPAPPGTMPWAQAAQRGPGAGAPGPAAPPYAHDTSLTPPTWNIGGPVQRQPEQSSSQARPPFHTVVASPAAPMAHTPPRATVSPAPQPSSLWLSITAAVITPVGLILHLALLIAIMQADPSDVGGYGGLTILAAPIGGTIALLASGTALAFAIRSRSRTSITLASTAMAIWLITVILAVTTIVIGLVRDAG